MIVTENSKTLFELRDPFLKEFGVTVYVKREDLVHPIAGGNKFRKLKYNIERAQKEKKSTLVTFGGVYSNHIAATAYLGKENDLKTIGIIRGEKPASPNITLKRAVDCGMELKFVERNLYRIQEKALEYALSKSEYDFDQCYIVPEGGSNYEGYKGCCEIVPEIGIDFDYVCCPCGTGTTLAGLASAINQRKKQSAIGFSVLKNNFEIEKQVRNFLQFTEHKGSFRMFHDYHFGGYAKSTIELIAFINRFNSINQIRIEPVYTGKMFFGIYDLVKEGFFKSGETVIAIHTGGLQYLEEK